MTCCLPAIPLDGRFIRRCKQGGLQFVILKPILVAVTFLLYSKKKYEDGNFSAKEGYLYITIIYTISYSLALYALVLFYVACKDLLRPFKPVPKFIIIKSVVFLTYWQGVLVFLAAKSGFIKNSNDAADVQNFIICVEMAVAAIVHLYAFPYKEYAEANISSSVGLANSITHALNFNDFYYDTVHQFAPTYHDYVLYSDGSQEAPTRYRVRTFVPTGLEMETLRKHKQMFGAGKLDEAYMANVPMRDTDNSKKTKEMDVMENSLLFDPHNPFSTAYDMSPIGTSSDSKGQQVMLDDSLFNFDRRRSTISITGANDSRRTSLGDEALETTRLAPGRRRSSQGVLADETDSYGEQDQMFQGYIQR
ncbi:hypothetical protein KP509_19G009400 [Ceratopteris richardii]|nr:hypothetical protein KP509_19G009400 [Ceratopteris richardii]